MSVSMQTKVSIPDDTDDISFALKNYLTSISLKENGWYALVNSRNISLGSSGCTRDNGTDFFNCEFAYIWMNPQNHRQYALYKKGNGESNAAPLFKQLLSLGYADMPTLVEGAYNCTAQVRPPFIVIFHALAKLFELCSANSAYSVYGEISANLLFYRVNQSRPQMYCTYLT